MAHYICNLCKRDSYQDNFDKNHICAIKVQEAKKQEQDVYFDPVDVEATERIKAMTKGG